MKKYRKRIEVIGKWFPDGSMDVFEIRFTGRLVGSWFTDDEPNYNSPNEWEEWRIYELPSSKRFAVFHDYSEPSAFYDKIADFEVFDRIEYFEENVPAGLVDQVRKATGREYLEPVFDC